ncbi:hypothetical protein AKJ65_07340 [candidate division MSBL1 archaeon SCGC-AAA259E19]|uniref:Uncharacterized protein n=1 Tax=candidate division MSBL1 archaeon SCGC-AAA259E19 TaxID=1698264 RepID=A0A133UEG9_9EURY|nr:hypothetical protein AKJ65_07340 [candidate division MSBL1 archaeon SCGC-AAA259E19]
MKPSDFSAEYSIYTKRKEAIYGKKEEEMGDGFVDLSGIEEMSDAVTVGKIARILNEIVRLPTSLALAKILGDNPLAMNREKAFEKGSWRKSKEATL